MSKIQLHYDKMLQGKFSLQKLNLLFVFQVNCPGCFLYGIPIMNKIYRQFHERMAVLGLSTAFEDFEYNNSDNTHLLVRDKSMVGETKKALATYGYEKYPYSIEFPVAMDTLVDSSSYPIDKAVDQIVAQIHGFDGHSSAESEIIRANVREFLGKQPKLSLTFSMNSLRGTPSFVLFDDKHDIIAHWFGHKPENDVISAVFSLVEQYNR